MASLSSLIEDQLLDALDDFTLSEINMETDEIYSSTLYTVRTIHQHNRDRLTILPIFPPTHVAPYTNQIHLLLSNVPLELLSNQQKKRFHSDAYPQLFKLEFDHDTNNLSESFLLQIYHDFYIKIKKRLGTSIPVLDCNLARLCDCIHQVAIERQLKQTTLNLDELAIALEFYLQIDVDTFYLKTCTFNGAQPRSVDDHFYESLFCLAEPEAAYGITPCKKRSCMLCQTKAIAFSQPHIHQFVNQYQAILNAPVVCDTKQCIYVLTCPCGQYDFIGETKSSLNETFASICEEGNRIVRKFLLGQTNDDLKSEQQKTKNDKLWLYQHSTQCSFALRCFLDLNPLYWCFVPMILTEKMTTTQPTVFQPLDTTTLWQRQADEIHLLIANVPQPPNGFDFSLQQRQQQGEFFRTCQDHVLPYESVHLYDIDIIAVLPNNSTKLLRQTIQSLLITHAECKLNELGHIVCKKTNPLQQPPQPWCSNLMRH